MAKKTKDSKISQIDKTIAKIKEKVASSAKKAISVKKKATSTAKKADIEKIESVKKSDTKKKGSPKKTNIKEKEPVKKVSTPTKKLKSTIKRNSTAKKESNIVANNSDITNKSSTTTSEKVSVKKKNSTSTAKRDNTAKKSSSVTAKKTSTAKKSSSVTAKKASTAKKSSSVTAKKVNSAKKNSSVTSKKVNPAKKIPAITSKKSDIIEKDENKKATVSKKKASSTVKKQDLANKKANEKKTTKVAKNSISKKFQSEYYDLPYLYNKTVVRVLAQTPKMLFIYWEISETDRKRFQKQYGERFFENTRPVLVVFNDTMHYSFEVAINDFANSWYLHIEDPDCEYHVELGRRPIDFIQNSPEATLQNTQYIPYYIYLTSSNEMAAPNNHILFDPTISTVKFRNVKTGQITYKDAKQFTFITNFGIFTVQDLYRYLYPDESFEYENIVLGHTSSGALSSSGMFSSQFK